MRCLPSAERFFTEKTASLETLGRRLGVSVPATYMYVVGFGDSLYIADGAIKDGWFVAYSRGKALAENSRLNVFACMTVPMEGQRCMLRSWLRRYC